MKNYKIGDKVAMACNTMFGYSTYVSSYMLGEVIRVTPKGTKVTVDFKTKIQEFMNTDINKLKPVTEEILTLKQEKDKRIEMLNNACRVEDALHQQYPKLTRIENVEQINELMLQLLKVLEG